MPLWNFVLDGLKLLCAKFHGLNRMQTPRINSLFIFGPETIGFLYKYNEKTHFWQTRALKQALIDVWTKLTDFVH